VQLQVVIITNGKERKMAPETVKEVFETMPKVFAADKASGVDAVFQFHITGRETGDWYIVVKNSACEISQGIHDKPSVSLTLADVDWVAICAGQLDGMTAFMSGKLKATGNVMMAQQIRTLFPLT